MTTVDILRINYVLDYFLDDDDDIDEDEDDDDEDGDDEEDDDEEDDEDVETWQVCPGGRLP